MTEKLPTRTEALWFEFRAACFRAKRTVLEWNGAGAKRLHRAEARRDTAPVVESRTVLFNSSSPAEFALQAGKVHNLRLAARQLNGVVIRANELFSFWKNVGRASRRRGFVEGRELREGCVIPNVGGGLCQLSNALYDVALRSGCEIVERHAHTQQVPGSTTKPGRNATIFWNYVDLRFRPRFDCQLRVELSRGELIVGLISLKGEHPAPAIEPVDSCETRVEAAETCETCGVTKCFRNPAATSLPRRGITAWLLDKFEPEFDRWMKEHEAAGDAVFVPIRSARLSNYSWSVDGFDSVKQARLATLLRSAGSRRLAQQGAARQRALLEFDRMLASAYADRIPPTADHLVVSQNLLPHLWRRGDLSGRTFDVLMTRLPIASLEETLDAAARLHPDSPTLADYRAPADIRNAESEALGAARFLVTPHSGIAALFGERAVKLPWILPRVAPELDRLNRSSLSGDASLIGASKGNLDGSELNGGLETAAPWRGRGAVVFPANTLARKGCYELRTVAGELNLELQLGGAVLEAPNFWDGVTTTPMDEDGMRRAALVVLPSFVEHWPRRLLRAAAAGVPVIASEGCGLRGIQNVKEIPVGDVVGLRSAIAEVLGRIRA